MPLDYPAPPGVSVGWITELHVVEHGAGAISIELGQFYARMGTRVTILQRSGRILSHDDLSRASDSLRAHWRPHRVRRRLAARPGGARAPGSLPCGSR